VAISQDKRQSQRIKVCCKMEIAASEKDTAAPVVRPGHSVDLSMSGACVNTSHEVWPGQEIEVALSTNAAADLGLPSTLRGRATVQRVEPQEGGWWKVALAFAPGLAHSMEMAMYVTFLMCQQAGMVNQTLSPQSI